MQLKGNIIKDFLLCVIDVFSKYTWVVPMKSVIITHAFQKTLDKSGHKPKKIWLGKDSKF